MREINFRAWHREKKCWLDTVHVFNDGSWSGSIIEERGEIDGYDERECELMQYTGLKDKNGKEIYEGDVIRGKKLDYFIVAEIQEVVVEYVDGGFYPFADNNDYAPYPKPTEVEVIGNIYEHLELLKFKVV